MNCVVSKRILIKSVCGLWRQVPFPFDTKKFPSYSLFLCDFWADILIWKQQCFPFWNITNPLMITVSLKGKQVFLFYHCFSLVSQQESILENGYVSSSKNHCLRDLFQTNKQTFFKLHSFFFLNRQVTLDTNNVWLPCKIVISPCANLIQSFLSQEFRRRRK